MIVVSYDVGGTEKADARRLRRVAKRLESIGQRVQYSVFECLIEPSDYELLKADLLKLIDTEIDALRIYNLGKNWQRRVETYGLRKDFDMESNLVV